MYLIKTTHFVVLSNVDFPSRQQKKIWFRSSAVPECSPEIACKCVFVPKQHAISNQDSCQRSNVSWITADAKKYADSWRESARSLL